MGRRLALFIGNLRYKSNTGKGPFEVPTDSNGQELELPTGSGFSAWQPSVTMIYPSDPVVFYSNLNYIYNVGATYGGNRIDPGDSIGASLE